MPSTPRTTDTSSTVRRLTALVTDPSFLRIERLGRQANLFHILGRTYTETWHSMLLGWLLDTRGSHGFGEYGLRLFAGAVAGSQWAAQPQDWAALAAFGDFRDTQVTPNERSPHEASFEDGSRPDVNIDHVRIDRGTAGPTRFKLVIEQKVLARPTAEQLDRYEALCTKNSELTFLGVLVAPIEQLTTVSDYLAASTSWSALGFQALHDQFLVPLQEHPDLDDRARLVIGDYVACLRSWKKGIAPVITAEERQLAKDIYDRHKAAFQIIAHALRDSVEPASLPEEPEDEQENQLLILVNGSEISGVTVREFMQNLLEHLLKTGALDLGEANGTLPYQTSTKRYFVNRTGKHPEGNPFHAAVRVGEWFLEAHSSRAQAIRNACKLARRLGCEVVEPD